MLKSQNPRNKDKLKFKFDRQYWYGDVKYSAKGWRLHFNEKCRRRCFNIRYWWSIAQESKRFKYQIKYRIQNRYWMGCSNAS